MELTVDVRISMTSHQEVQNILFLTQKATSHPKGPITAPHGGPDPGGPAVAGRGWVVLMDIPPMTISARRVPPRMTPTNLLCPNIYVDVI